MRLDARWCEMGLAAAIVLLVAATATAVDAPSAVPRPPRPERSEAERAALSRELRAIYSRQPTAWPPPEVDPGVEWRELGRLQEVVHPDANPYTAAKAALGRTLFHDPRLSASGTMACVTCHEPLLGWADGRRVSEPHGDIPGRNAPAILNTAFMPTLFWDGRAASLEEQAEQALTNPREMAADPDRVVTLIAESPGYRQLYTAAFAGEQPTFAGVVAAIACFERTVVGGRSRFDGFLAGDAAALTDAELIGLDLFRREARCLNCHHGPTFSDGKFHDLGLSFHGRSNEDLGRHTITKAPADKGRFRTPTLRNVTRTAPLMHTGMFELRGVLSMYNAGMVTLKRQAYERDDPHFPLKSPLLKPLGLNRQDLADLAAFLHTLEEPKPPSHPPPLPALHATEATVTAGP
ncbi:MAG: cytochrome c peroxidase [Pirellulales bacterium]